MVKVKSYHLTHYCGGHVRYINQKQRRALHFTNDKISSSRAHDPAQWFAKSREYMHSVKRRKPCLLSSAGILKTGLLSSAPPPFLESPGVTVIWASPRFRHPHFVLCFARISRFPNSSDMGIPCNPNPIANPNRKGNMRRECPYH